MSNPIEQVRELLNTHDEELKSAPVEGEIPEELLIDDEAVEVDEETPQVDEVVELDTETYTVSSFAEAVGWTPEEMYGIEVPMPDGEAVPLGKLKDEYQSAMRDKTAAEAQIEEFKAQLGNAQGMAQQGQGVSQKVIDTLARREAIVSQYQGIDWDEMEKSNPGEAALYRQKYQVAFANANSQVEAAQAEQQQVQVQYLQQAKTQMLDMIPEWKDNAVMTAEQEEIRQSMRNDGYSDVQINSVADPLSIKIYRELMQLRKEKAAAVGAVKTVRKAPKRIKGSSPMNTRKKVDSKVLADQVRNAPRGQRKQSEFDAVKTLFKQG